MKIKIKKICRDAKVPKYALSGDAGMDLFCVEDCILKPSVVCSIKTGIAMELPQNYVALVWDKSGMAIKNSLKTVGGVIDSGYRGEIVIGMINLGKSDYVLKSGDKVAQLLIQKIEHPEIVEVKELTNSDRGVAGFGSTGKK